MHATIQKPLDEIAGMLKEGEKVFVVGCYNCATKCKSGGPEETGQMAKRLADSGVNVTGWTVPGPQGMSLCKLSNTKKVLMEDNREAVDEADSYIILACGQGVHTVMDATDGGDVHPGCDTIFGGETVSDGYIAEYCSLCGECIIDMTGGLCPLTLCAKQLLNGPCGGAKDGKCEVLTDRDCGWALILERLKKLGKLEQFYLNDSVVMKRHCKFQKPRDLTLEGARATFRSCAMEHAVEDGVKTERKGER